ncbi:MAG: hypothetical protein AB1644_05660 [Candidatus Zixiibacteriota bacterium]
MMDYGRLLNHSWNLAWRFKSLWVLGIFVSGGVPFSMSWQDDTRTLSQLGASDAVILTLFVVATTLATISLILYFLTSGSLIDAVNRITRGGSYRLGESFSNGFHFFWRMVGLGLLAFMSILVVVAVCAVPAILLFLVSTVLGVISLFILVPVAIAGIFVVAAVYQLAERVVVVRDSVVGDAIDEAWMLFRRHLGQNVILTLMYLCISLGFGMVFMMLAALVAVPFVVMALTSTAGLILALAFGIPAVLLVAILVEGISGAFTSAMYTLFYFELLGSPATPPATAPSHGVTV